jgi:hypothetical protein
MPQINKYGDAVTDAQRLLVAMLENASSLPDVTAERTELELMLGGVQDAKSRQDFHNSERQRATQDLSAAINRYKEAAIQIRSIARAALGVRNAKLAQFRVQPLRKRKSRTAPTTTTIKTPAPAVTEAAPAGSTATP